MIDSIVSNPGVLLPWKELVTICKEENVWSIVDAAHSIGQEVNIDLEKSGPDFWVSVSVMGLEPPQLFVVSGPNILRLELPQVAFFESILRGVVRP